MDIGAFIFPTEYSIDISELATELEQRGYKSIMVCEHTHIPAGRRTPWPGGGELPKEYYHTYDPFIALTMAAKSTQTIRLGTSICLVPQHNHFNLAKSVASLDRLSNGRFIFGIGGGWNVDEMENHGALYKTRFKLMRERVLAMKELWTKEQAEFHGEYIDFDPVYSWPKPIQTPNPPILLGGETNYTLKRVVEFCDGWLPRGPIDMVDGMTRLRTIADKAGRDPSTLSVTVFRAKPDLDTLGSYRETGVNSVLLQVPSEDRDTCLKLLDKYTPLLQ